MHLTRWSKQVRTTFYKTSNKVFYFTRGNKGAWKRCSKASFEAMRDTCTSSTRETVTFEDTKITSERNFHGIGELKVA